MPLGNLLFNVSTICLSIVTFYSILSRSNRHDSYWVVGLLFGLTAVLCMMFPFHIIPWSPDNLGAVILLLGALYGGYKASVLLTSVAFLYQILFHSIALLHIVVSVTPVALLVVVMIPRFIYYSRTKKCLAVVSLELLSATMHVVTHLPISHLNLRFLLTSLTIQVAYLLLCLLFIETMRSRMILMHDAEERQRAQLLVSLTSAIAHDIRSPLTVCIGFVQLLQENVKDEPSLEYLSVVQSELKHASSVIRKYLSYAEPEAGPYQVVEVTSAVAEAISLVAKHAVQHHVEIEENLTGPLNIVGDSGKLTQALQYMMTNGIDAMPEGGTLTVRAYQRALAIRIDIIDTGVGMSPEQVARLGSPFYITTEKGTGISMMISYRFIQFMQGHIHVKSKVGEGTQFSVVFPIVKSK